MAHDDRHDDQAEDESAELSAGHGVLSPRTAGAAYRVIWAKRRVVSVSATSVGSRSIELAP